MPCSSCWWPLQSVLAFFSKIYVSPSLCPWLKQGTEVLLQCICLLFSNTCCLCVWLWNGVLGWSWTTATCSSSHSLIPPSSTGQGEKIKWERSWVKIERGITYRLPSQAKQTWLEEKNILLPIKIDLDCKKQRQNWNNTFPPTNHPFSQAQLHSFIPNLSLPPSGEEGVENGGCGQSIKALLCHSFLLTLSLCSNAGPSQAAASYRTYPPSPLLSTPWLAVWISVLTYYSMGCSVDFQSLMVLSTSFGESPAPLWSFQGLRGNLCSSTWNISPPLLPSVHRAVSHTFSLAPQQYFDLSTHAFPKVPHAWLRGLAVSCSGTTGAGRNQPCPTWGCPGLSSQSFPPCSPLPIANT